jgi:hypothetical protein
MKKKYLLTFIVLVLFFYQSIFSANGSNNNYPHGRYGIGFQRITWNCWGLSAMFELTPKLAIEGLYGLFGDRQAYGFRALYRFIKLEKANIYGYGLIGAETVEEWGKYDETGLLVGAGGGIEYNLEKVLADMISIGVHAEMGVENLSGYKYINADYTSFIFSAGFHIRI